MSEVWKAIDDFPDYPEATIKKHRVVKEKQKNKQYNETWKLIDGYDGIYSVSTLGRVRNNDTLYIKKQSISRDNLYWHVALQNKYTKKTDLERVHRLVAKAFIPNPENKKYVNHIDGNKLNNRIDNLEWVTNKENLQANFDTGLVKAKPIRVIETGDVFISISECARHMDTRTGEICAVLLGKRKSFRGLTFEYVETPFDFLRDHQISALYALSNGKILCGGVGTGKTRVGLAYYFLSNGGSLYPKFEVMHNPKDLIIITTARKRDSLDFEREMIPFLFGVDDKYNVHNNRVTVDSWNNIKKYKDCVGCFFLFDESRVSGTGPWVKAFLNITKYNDWILLSATPGDSYVDYAPVLIANGYYRNITEFRRDHIIYKSYSKYPVIDRYLNTSKLDAIINDLLVDMPMERHTVQNHFDVWTTHNMEMYRKTMRTRWDPYKNQPIATASELCYVLRKICNNTESRVEECIKLYEKHKKVIVFYNFDYEWDLMKVALKQRNIYFKSWNGHIHEPLPEGIEWVYLCQIVSSAEAWSAITCNTIIFFSQTYSYKTLVQACGRIDRLNTPYVDLYYYHLKSRSHIDVAISRALRAKKKFNEKKFVGGFTK